MFMALFMLGFISLSCMALDGVIDADFNTGGSGFDYNSASGSVHSIVTQSDGKILVGGYFTNYNNADCPNNIVRLNPDGTLDTSFNAGGSGTNISLYGYIVKAIALQSDGKILVGGNFTQYNDSDCPDKLIRLNEDGTLDTSFNAGGTGFDPGANYIKVMRIALQSDGKIIVGGDIKNYNGVNCPDGLVRLNSDGTLDTAFNTGGAGFDVTGGQMVRAIKVMDDDKILVGGDFTTYNSVSNKRFVRLDADGTIDVSFNNGKPDYKVGAIALQSNGRMILGGDFTKYGEIDCTDKLIYLFSDGSLDTSFNLGGSGFSSTYIYSLQIQSDGKILVARDYGYEYNGTACNNGLVRINGNGSLDTSFNEGGNGFDNAYVYAVALQDDGKILVGGQFGSYNGYTCNRALTRLTNPSLSSSIENGFKLSVKNYPNPFNPTTTIEFNLENDCRAELCVYNVKGEKVKTLVDDNLEKGVYQKIWNGTDESGNLAASGVYFYKIKAGSFEKTEKMLLIK